MIAVPHFLLPPIGLSFFSGCCCGGTPGADCSCCGNGYATDTPGGPLQFTATIAAVTGTCSGGFPGGSCSGAGGTHFLDWGGPTTPCVWESPPFSLCGGSLSHLWVLSMGSFANCGTNARNSASLVLTTTGGGFWAQYGNEPGGFACNASSTLFLRTNLTGGCSLPASLTIAPV